MAFFNPELSAKRLELLREVFPRIKSVAVLLNPNNPISRQNFETTDLAAKALDIELKQFGVRGPNDFESAFMDMANSQIEAVAVLDDAMLIVHARTIGLLGLKQHLPTIGFKEIAEGGGLMSYAVDFPDMFRQSTRLIDKIFRGTKPSDIPVEQVTKFELVINLKTAAALAVKISPMILARADKVIE